MSLCTNESRRRRQEGFVQSDFFLQAPVGRSKSRVEYTAITARDNIPQSSVTTVGLTSRGCVRGDSHDYKAPITIGKITGRKRPPALRWGGEERRVAKNTLCHNNDYSRKKKNP